MGQKVCPLGLRLGIINKPFSDWYASTNSEYRRNIELDYRIRNHIYSVYHRSIIDCININKTQNNLEVTIYSNKPGMILGKKNASILRIRKEISTMCGLQVSVDVNKNESDANLLGESIAVQLQSRTPLKRIIKRFIGMTKKSGWLGMKVCVSGRIGGAEIARSDKFAEGRIPLHTLSANIEYCCTKANTIYGVLGIKVWICKSIDRKIRRRI